MPGTDHVDVDRSKFGTTSAGQVDSVTFATNYSEAEIIMKSPANGSTGLFVTGDASVPSSNGDDTDWVPPSAGAAVRVPLEGGGDVVKIFSATADAYTVRGVTKGYSRNGSAGAVDGGTP